MMGESIRHPEAAVRLVAQVVEDYRNCFPSDVAGLVLDAPSEAGLLVEQPPAAKRLAEGDTPNDPDGSDLGVPDVHP